MSTLLDERVALVSTGSANRLRNTMAAVRVAFTWFGTRKSLTPAQKAQAADAFGAEGTYLSAGKKLIDTSHPAFKCVTAVRGRLTNYWRSITLPYPEPGVRLIRQQDIAGFDVMLTTAREELEEAVWRLDEHYAELRSAARRRLGSLFNPGDYPESLTGLFGVAWEFPSIEPPSYLRELCPALFQQEQARIAARFEEAVQMAEEAFVGELNRLVSHLTERLSGTDDGKPKVFRDSAIENLREFFDRFRQLNVRSNEQLDQLVEQARRIVGNVEPQQLRNGAQLRQHVASQLAGVQAALDGMLVDRPRRNIQRRPK